LDPYETTTADPAQVEDRLRKIGVPLEALHEAIRQGELARASCTKNDAITAPGYLAWERTLRTLREQLAPLGWTVSRRGRLETAASPDGETAITVATGDDGVSQAAKIPKTKSVKGTATAAAIANNVGWLFPELAPPAVAPPPRATWVLLLHRAAECVLSELSLPTEMDEDGRVAGWRERILLPAVPVDQPPEPTKRATDEDDVVVEVSLRS
jgi:hypothetical protein